MSGCGSSGGCSCGGGAAQAIAPAASEAPPLPRAPLFEAPAVPPAATARVNGVPLHGTGERPDEEALRQRACVELLRQEAQRTGLLAVGDAPSADGIVSDAASAAIECLLERDVTVPEPSEEACRRHHAARSADYAQGERVRARHVLFAVTPGIEVQALRRRAEALLVELRCADSAGNAFAEAAACTSNCPSGQAGGDLGWLTAADCAPEFAREILGKREIGVLPRLVATRFGLHVVEVLEREAGVAPDFDFVRSAVAAQLKRHAWACALGLYLQRLAAGASMEGVSLEAGDSPLVQ